MMRLDLGLDEQPKKGPLDARWALVARDLALEPEIWRGFGVDPEYEGPHLPSPAREVYLEAKTKRRRVSYNKGLGGIK